MLQLFVRRLFLCRHPKLFSLFCAAATLTFVLIIRLTTTYDFRLRLRYLPAIDGHTSEHLRKIREAGTGNKIPAKLSIRNPQSLSVKGDRSDTFHWRVADTVSDKGDSKQYYFIHRLIFILYMYFYDVVCICCMYSMLNIFSIYITFILYVNVFVIYSLSYKCISVIVIVLCYLYLRYLCTA